MRGLSSTVFLALGALGGSAFLLAACGDEATNTTSSATSASTSGGGAGGEATSGPGGGGAGGAGGAGPGSGGAGTGGSGVGGAGGGDPNNCASPAPAPIDETLVIGVLNGSEDIAFDGKGNIAGKQGGNVVLVDSTEKVTTLATLAGTVYGVRFRANGDLVAALPNSGKIVQITPGGVVSDYVTGLSGPNGVYPDADDNIWVTQFNGNKVSRINPDKSIDDIVTGNDASSANGVVYDAARSTLFYTNYSAGMVRSTKIPPSGAPAVVATIAGAKLDGMVMDACGNLYVVNQGGSELYRILLDASGMAIGAPELIASFPKNVANAQFGSGPGFDAMTLYAAGSPGSVYAVPVGIPGAAIPTAP